jgi:excisionase family DNA binding protein
MVAREGPGEAVPFLSRTEVARILGVSPNTVSRWAREGRLPCQLTLGGHRRFDRRLVEDIRRRLSGTARQSP